MGKSKKQALDIINKIRNENKTVDELKTMFLTNEDWYRVSNLAYNIQLEEARRENVKSQKKPHVLVTPNETINDIFSLNDTLSNYALGIPLWATERDYEKIKDFANDLPSTEQNIIDFIESINMHPKWRAQQKKGRISQYEIFKEFDKIVDSSLISYYRQNYIACFLTLAPVIEGVLLKWKRYDGFSEKPEFDDYRKFFKQGPLRQPCPGNIQFHRVYSSICDNIINKTLYKPTFSGDAHSDFNRHVALHMLKKSKFGTKNNCTRLFLLLDFMTEIYWYEGKFPDPRWNLNNDDILLEFSIYSDLKENLKNCNSAEEFLLR